MLLSLALLTLAPRILPACLKDHWRCTTTCCFRTALFAVLPSISKTSGPSNCVCLSLNSRSNFSAANLDASVNRYVASCGSGSTYGLFQPGASGLNNGTSANASSTSSASTRRLLQLRQPGMMMPTATGGNTPMGASANTNFTQNLNQTRTLFNNTSANTTNSNSSRVCFNAFAPVVTPAARACSTQASTPPPLPIEWMIMNRLNPANADTCKLFTPANATTSIDCVRNQN
jgi:hypothetical protein